ncbi:hypothetical protein [Intrasporangium sp. DVR]|uniref:hypothetical protein n=1 Tax=Intrasporangium sp. DVR TaxID=3127867 RepID=UPI00313A72A7
MTNNENGSGLRPSRRTVVKGAAWAVPAVAVAASTPASASSPEEPEINFELSSLCKLPGQSSGAKCYDKGNVAFLVFDNTKSSQDYTICAVTGMFNDGKSLCVVGISDPAVNCGEFADSIVIPAGETKTIAVWTNGATESSGGVFTVEFTGGFTGECTAAEPQTGNLKGGSWTSGGGSCDAQPDGCSSIPSICGTGKCGATA